MRKLGLRIKFFLYSNTLIVVTMSLVTIFAVVHERQTRFAAIERRGQGIVEALALPIADALAAGDASPDRSGLVLRYLERTRELNLDLMRYAIVADRDGVVSISIPAGRSGERFERALLRDRGDRPLTELLEPPPGSDRPTTLEIRTALASGGRFLGSLTIGFSLGPIERQVMAIATRAALAALVLLIGNSALTAVYVETLIRPILALHQSIRRATHGDLSVRARSASAEVGELAEAFNQMMDELEEAREREKVRQAQLAHTEKMAAVGTLAAGVAHEVNNPLGGILTCIENLRADPSDQQTLARYLDLIHDGLKRIERTVANLLDFSRERRMVLEPTSINHNLRHVVELVEYQLRKGGVEVVMDLDPEEPYVLADHFQMEQLFLNLVLNALQAMPDGGTLTLWSRARDGRLVVEVRDTGTGIPEQIRERIFDPFFTTRDVDEGTGLGLAVSDSIVAAHGATLEVESAEQQGSVFRVTLSTFRPEADQEDPR